MLAITTTPGTSDSVGAAGGLFPQPKLQQLLLRGASAARSAEVKVEEVQRTSATTAATTDRRHRLKEAKTETGDDPMKTKNKRTMKAKKNRNTTTAAVTTAITTATTPAVITCEDVCPKEQPRNNAACDMEPLGDIDCDCEYIDISYCLFTCMDGQWYMYMGCSIRGHSERFFTYAID